MAPRTVTGRNIRRKDFGIPDLPEDHPRFIEPMYAKSAPNVPESQDWLYEVKLDGYRCLAGRNQKGVTLWSRRGNLFTNQFPAIARACEVLEPDILIDGEVVALDESGRSSFNVLQHHRSKARAILFYAFDLLIYRGRSLLDVPLEQRRELLTHALGGIVGSDDSLIRISETFSGSPAALISAVEELEFEGIVAKKKDSSYETGRRSGSWLKYHVNKSQEFVVGGYTIGDPFDALVVGHYEGDSLLFVAKVRNGFVSYLRREVAREFKGLEIDTCPFANLPEKKRTPHALTREEMKKCRWLNPSLVAQIAFNEWTPDGHLRQASFVGLRTDKSPADIGREE